MNRFGVAVEVHEYLPVRLGLAKNREINQARTEVEHARGVERPLITLAEDIGDEFLSRAVVIGEEITFAALRVDGIDIGQTLRVGAREVPGKGVARRADAELALGEIDGLDARLQREPQRAEAMFGIDAVAVEFAGRSPRPRTTF